MSRYNPTSVEGSSLTIYACARCGREYSVGRRVLTDEIGRTIVLRERGSDGRPVPVRPFVRIGGKPVCEECAKLRFRRRRDPDALVAPEAIR